MIKIVKILSIFFSLQVFRAFISALHLSPYKCHKKYRVVISSKSSLDLAKRISPNQGESMDEYRNAILNTIREETKDKEKFGGRELLELVVKKWGVAYDIQLRKTKPFGEGSENIYCNIMWRYLGQKSFPMTDREYLEHLEALSRYITSVDRVGHFKEKVSESMKRPNAYFGYAVSIPLDVHPDTADTFFKNLEYDN